MILNTLLHEVLSCSLQFESRWRHLRQWTNSQIVTSQASPMDNALPVKFWGLDPLHWIHVKLFVRDVLQLKNYPGFKGKHFNNVKISESET